MINVADESRLIDAEYSIEEMLEMCQYEEQKCDEKFILFDAVGDVDMSRVASACVW